MLEGSRGQPSEAIVGGTELISSGGKAFPVGGPLVENDLIELGAGPVQRAKEISDGRFNPDSGPKATEEIDAARGGSQTIIR